MVEGTFSVLGRLANLNLRGVEFRTACMEALAELPGYDWCGVYRLEPTSPGQASANSGRFAAMTQTETCELVLDAYVGAPTEHDRIPIGRGVCGTAVSTGENQIVDDVRDIDNYLSCSIETRSEIVVLIKKLGADQPILGQIDIDSHQTGRFTKADEHMLEGIASLMAERW